MNQALIFRFNSAHIGYRDHLLKIKNIRTKSTSTGFHNQVVKIKLKVIRKIVSHLYRTLIFSVIILYKNIIKVKNMRIFLL